MSGALATLIQISGLPAATTPISGSDLVPISQSGIARKISVTSLFVGNFSSPPPIGNVTPNTGAFTNLFATAFGMGTDWLTGTASYQLPWPITGARAYIISNNGQIAITNASRASDLSNSYGSLQTTIGTASFAFNDDVFATSARHVTVYAGYDEAQTLAGSSGLAFGREIDGVNFGTQAVATTPGAPIVYGSTVALWLASGGGHSGVTDATAAIGIVSNNAKWRTGIIIGSTALTQDGNGFQPAMKLPKKATISWYDTSDVASANITSTIGTAANAQYLQFTDGGTVIGSVASGNGLFQVVQTANATNGVVVTPNTAGNAAVLGTFGTDTNIGLNITLQGAGSLYVSSGATFASAVQINGNTTLSAGTFTVSIGQSTVQALTAASLVLASPLNAQYGGTGVNGSTAANGSLLIGNGFGYGLATLTGTASNLIVTNAAASITLQAQGKQLPGTTTNDAASSGNVGEFIRYNLGSGIAAFLTTGTDATVVGSSVLTGDFDVWGTLYLTVGAGCTVTNVLATISNSGGTTASPLSQATQINFPISIVGPVTWAMPVGASRWSGTASGANICVNATFAGGTCRAYGTIEFRRRR
jgi:hypothetical protein